MVEMDKPSALIACESIFGKEVLVPREKLEFRPSVYAVVLHEDRLLVLRSRSSGHFCFPGGGIDIGETIFQGLRREVKEETGIDIEIGEFLHFKEHLFYYDPLDRAFHSFMVFYRCRPLTFELLPNEQVDDEESEHPQWVELHELPRRAIQPPLREVFDILQGRS